MARARKTASKRKVKRKTKKKATRKRASAKRPARRGAITRRVRAMGVAPPRVPRRKKGESLVKYHDRLSELIYEADRAGDVELSAALQAKAGELAEQHETVRAPRRGKRKKLRGPGTYPWYQCVEDQYERYGSMDRARKVCGRIRASSRSRYPIYWSVRGTGRRANPESPGDYAIIAAPDDQGWHWWASDERGQHLAAASTKPEADEEAAIAAAKRAIRKYDARTYAKPKKAGKKATKASSKRARLPSILTRI
jgi:hypothetical protein